MNNSGVGSRVRLQEPGERSRLATISSAVARRPLVLILGMHRSGTSLCSHLLSTLGVDMADQIPGPGHSEPGADNPRGHWERWEIVEFHDRILAAFNRGYYTPFHDFALPVGWWADPRVTQIRREITAFLEQRIGEAPFGFKDPRTVRLMPIWHQIIGELKLAPKVVLCLRSPAQVARSLHARDGLALEAGEYRWLNYMVDFFRYVGSLDFCTIEYEAWFDDPRQNLAKLTKFLDLEWQLSESELDLVLSDIVDPGLRHDESGRIEASQPLVRSLYKLATRAGEDAAAREKVGNLAAQFVAFQQLQRPFYSSFEKIAEAADGKLAATEVRLGEALGEIEAQRARLSAAEGERVEQIALSRGLGEETARLRMSVADGEAALAAAEARLAEALREMEAQRARLDEVEGGRGNQGSMLQRLGEETARLRLLVAEEEAALEAAKAKSAAAEERLAEVLAEIEAQRARLTEVQGDRDDQAAMLQRLGEETARLRTSVAEGEATAAAAARAAAAAEARVAQIEAERDDQATMLKRFGEEIARLRGAVADGEAALEAANANVAAAEARLSETQAELDAQQARVIRFEIECREQDAALQRLVEETHRLSNALAEGEAALQTADGDRAAAQARLAELIAETEAQRTWLSESEAARDEQIAAAELLRERAAELEAGLFERQQAIGGLKARLAEREADLASATGRAAESEGHFAMALKEISALHDEMSRSEVAAHQYIAEKQALQGEVTTLRYDLAAARQVGKAMLAALRTTAEAPPPVIEGGAGGRRIGIFRLFGFGRPRAAG